MVYSVPSIVILRLHPVLKINFKTDGQLVVNVTFVEDSIFKQVVNVRSLYATVPLDVDRLPATVK